MADPFGFQSTLAELEDTDPVRAQAILSGVKTLLELCEPVQFPDTARMLLRQVRAALAEEDGE